MTIPSTHQTVMPYLILDGAKTFLNFVKAVFSAIIISEIYSELDQQKLMHSEVCIGTSTIMLCDSSDIYTAKPANLFIYVDDADNSLAQSLAHGGEVVQPISDQSYGRTFGVNDPCGNTWWVTAA